MFGVGTIPKLFGVGRIFPIPKDVTDFRSLYRVITLLQAIIAHKKMTLEIHGFSKAK